MIPEAEQDSLFLLYELRFDNISISLIKVRICEPVVTLKTEISEVNRVTWHIKFLPMYSIRFKFY
jgi:hypothetical protein